ncbi:hypothetical protein CASFOL_032453 [Castilleja foliolosa]|uniref:Uncharacterized protein n=1 Tax=Castilleja foliolosa TaxID=1961234 RepID=A0ABD3C256_9LAMI
MTQMTSSYSRFSTKIKTPGPFRKEFTGFFTQICRDCQVRSPYCRSSPRLQQKISTDVSSNGGDQENQ